MAGDADIMSAVQAIKAASKKVQLTHDLEESIEQLNSITKLLEIDAPSAAVLQRLSLLLRQTLLPLYNTFLILGIRYAVAVLGTIFNAKVLPALKNCSANSVAAWEAVQASLLSGVLDFLESSSSYETRDIVANSFYPTLRGIFFPGVSPTFRPGPDLMYILCQVLSETVTSHPDNQAQLRRKDVLGGAELGTILSQSKNILVIEALLELIVKLLPSKRTSAAARIEFVQDVFDITKFACSGVILKIFETTPPSANWDIVFIKIIDLLGKTDSSFPQPFKTSNFHAQDSDKAYNIERLYVDHLGFVANIDEGNQIETLHALYASVQNLKVATPHDGKAAVTIVFSPPPSVGQVALATSSDRGTTVAFDIEAEDVARFLSSLKLRNVKSIDPSGKKLSKLGESLHLNFEPNDKHSTVSTQDKGRDLARLWDISNSQPHAGQVLSTSPLMPRAVSEIQALPTLATPTKFPNKGSVAKSSSPYYDSIFGTTDEELTDPSDTELNPTSRYSTRLSRGKQLRSSVKLKPEVAESDNESQIIRKVKSRRKTIILSDIEADRIKSPSQNTPDTANPNLSTSTGLDSRDPLKTRSLAEGNLPDAKADEVMTRNPDKPVLKLDSAGDSTHQPDPLHRANELPKSRRKRKSAVDDIPDVDGPDERPPPKRLRIRSEIAKNPTESKPPPKPAPAKRYGRKGRTSSPTPPSGLDLDFEVVPVPSSDLVSKPNEKQCQVKDKGGKTSAAKGMFDLISKPGEEQSKVKNRGCKTSAVRGTIDRKKLKTTGKKSTDDSTVVPTQRAQAKARTKGKTPLNDTKRPLPAKMVTEDKDKDFSKSAPQRRSARVAKVPDVTNEGPKMEQRSSAISLVELEEKLEDEDASEQVCPPKKPQRAPWEEISIKKPSFAIDTAETTVAGAVEPPAVPTIVQDAVTTETHVTVETPASPPILQEADAQDENQSSHMLDGDSVKPASSKKPAKDEPKPSKLETHKVWIDLTEDDPPLSKALTKSVIERKTKPKMKSLTPPPLPENISNCHSILSTITLQPSPESRPSLSKPDRPRVSFAPSASFTIQSTSDTALELEFETPKLSHYPKNDRPRVSFAPSASLAVQSTFDTTPELPFKTLELSHHPKKNEIFTSGNRYRRSQSNGQKVPENEHVQPMTRKRDTGPAPKILGILHEINEVMKHKTSYRFSKVSKDLRAGEIAILRETARHLEEMYIESAQHHNNFVNLETQYANHHRKIIDGLKDECEIQQKTTAFLAATIQEHNRDSLSRKFPNNFFNSPLPSILLNPPLKL